MCWSWEESFVLPSAVVLQKFAEVYTFNWLLWPCGMRMCHEAPQPIADSFCKNELKIFGLNKSLLVSCYIQFCYRVLFPSPVHCPQTEFMVIDGLIPSFFTQGKNTCGHKWVCVGSWGLLLCTVIDQCGPSGDRRWEVSGSCVCLASPLIKLEPCWELRKAVCCL